MALTLKSRIVDGVVIVDISGRLCFLEVALHDHIDGLLKDGQREFVLNLANVPYIDSFGLGQLISIWKSIRARGGQMILLRPTDYIQKLFQITKLDSIFPTSGDEAQAVTSAALKLTAPA
jgi:anti-sigma B factor antagonist